MRTTLTILLASATLAAPARAINFESGETRTALVELYTSEGCSSCPPAEARLAGLRDDPGLWKQFVPVAFHVDYWDRLGWRDRFASPVFTRRQYDYAARWHRGSVYTPALVQNGREGADPTPAGQPGRLRVEIKTGWEAVVTYQPVDPPAEGLIVEVAPLAGGVTSDVRRGENAGRKLVHEFVALDLLHAPLEKRGGGWMATLTLPAKADPSAALAVWVHAAGDPTPLQATGGWLQK